MKNHYLSFLLLLLVEGVFSAETDEVMSVMEGDSVTLQIDVTQIHGNETLLWKFNGERKFLAKIDRETNKITVPGNDDGRFKNRLQVDLTGSLTITKISTADSGLYTLVNGRPASYKTFRVTVYRVSDVETKPVIKGDSVTLQTGLTGLQTGKMIQWSYFTPEETLIARVTKGTDDKNITVFNAADVIFNDRLTVKRKTGSLIVSDVTTELSGLYKLEIITSQTTSKIFRVTVSERPPVVPDPRPSPAAPAAGLSIGIVIVLTLVAAAVGAGAVVIYYRCCKKQKATDGGAAIVQQDHLNSGS